MVSLSLANKNYRMLQQLKNLGSQGFLKSTPCRSFVVNTKNIHPGDTGSIYAKTYMTACSKSCSADKVPPYTKQNADSMTQQYVVYK